MDWLKEILGEELYNQLMTALNTHNGKPGNKEKQKATSNMNFIYKFQNHTFLLYFAGTSVINYSL